jgi:hypothetical protein
MGLYSSESPVQFILAQGDTLALTAEQRRSLELIELDLRSEIVRLSRERQLLELEAQRIKVVSGSGVGLTAERLATLDAITTKLRQALLRAHEQARATLSADQLAKLSVCDSKLPSFDFELSVTDGAGLDARIAEVVISRMKDAKVVEIETAQAIAERLFSWAKSFAILIGIPLALLAVVLSLLGINNWADFNHRIAQGKNDIDARIEAAKQRTKEFDTQAKDLRTQYADLKKQFGDVSALANDVQGIASRGDSSQQIFRNVARNPDGLSAAN